MMGFVVSYRTCDFSQITYSNARMKYENNFRYKNHKIGIIKVDESVSKCLNNSCEDY